MKGDYGMGREDILRGVCWGIIVSGIIIGVFLLLSACGSNPPKYKMYGLDITDDEDRAIVEIIKGEDL